MIKVLHLRSSGGFLGAEKVLTELGLLLPGLGIEPIIGIPVDQGDIPELASRCVALGIRTELFDFSNPLSLLGMRRIREFVKRERIDVIHTHGYREDIYAFLMLDRSRVVATNHLWKRTTFKLSLYAALDAFVMRYFATLVAVSQPIFAEMHHLDLPPKKLKLIENGISLHHYETGFPRRRAARTALGLADTDFVFGMVGSLSV
ncbi:MAG TPA: glycosyltransferase, partial [Spongiibacteraceae bacterium]